MVYRDDVAALEARHAALDDEVNRQTVERDRARTLLDDAKARLRLPVLDQVQVASPCTVDWEAMVGDEQVRHCGVCDKNVFNLSGMTREDAEAVITAANGTLCVRYFRRADGTILTADCPVGKRRVRRRRLVVAGATVLIAAAGALAYEFVRPSTLGAVSGPQPITQPSDLATQAIQGGLAPMSPPPIVEVKGDMRRDVPAALMGKMVAPLAPAEPHAPGHLAPHKKRVP